MTQFAPLDPFSPDDKEGIPAADPGQGAPGTAQGYGTEAEEPDQATRERADRDGDAREERQPEDVPFRTPDPDDVSRR
jgi:hypothetical protein